jgi:CHAT domain-containing protein/tetratricopeptide (TPR) repeat protein
MKTYLSLLLVLAFVHCTNAQCPDEINVKQLAANRNIEDLNRAIQVLEGLNNCKDSLALLYHNLGIAYRFVNPDLAIESTHKAITIRKELLPANQLDLGKSNHNLGVFYKESGQYEEAASYFKDALDVYGQIGSDRIIRSTQEYAGIMKIKGEYNKAIQYLEFALDQAKQYNKPMALAASYNDLATVYNRMKFYDKAIDNLIEAKNIYAQYPDNSKAVSNKAGVLINLSSSYIKLDDYLPSIENALLAEQISRELADKDYQAKALNNMGVCYKRITDYRKAEEAFLHSMQIRLDLNDHYAAAECYNNLGDVYQLEGDMDKAIKHYYAAVEMIIADAPEVNRIAAINPENLKNASNKTQLLGYFSDLGKGWNNYANLSSNPEHLNNALATFLVADQLIDLMRQEHTVQESKLFWRSQTRPIYERALEICYQLEDEERAFYFLEKSKAVLLLDALVEDDAKSVIPEALIEEEQALQSTLNEAKVKLESASWSQSEEMADARQQLIEAQEALDLFTASLENDYPQYHALKYQTEVISLESAKNDLLKPGEALLSYFYGDQALYMLKIENTGSVRYIKLTIDDDLEQAITQYLDLFATSTKRRNPDLAMYKNVAQKLFQKIYQPVYNEADKAVLIIPDGQLAFIPFDALLTDEEGLSFNMLNYLIKEQMIWYAWSASVLGMQQELEVKYKTVAHIAPGFQKGQRGLAPLLMESSANLKALGTFQAQEEELASLSNFKSIASESSILNLFTHANTGSDSLPPRVEFIDSSLLLSELYILPIQAELVVLGACETGIGQVVEGEGVMSLARGFAHAGAASLVASLWNVNDQQTAKLLDYFYANLKRGATKAEALHEAKLAFIENEDEIILPAQWAAFVLLGDAAKINRPTNWWTYLVAISVLALLGMIVLRRNKAV